MIPEDKYIAVRRSLLHTEPDEIRQQYSEAKNFLEDLTDFFLNKDKSRIVIVPGNHDVDWNVTKNLMTPIVKETEEEKKEYKKIL